MRKTDKVRRQETCNWLKTGKRKKRTEGMSMVAQNQAFLTNNIEKNW